jgi:hypothetical protein
MTLHDAIYQVLNARGNPMTVREIAYVIAQRELYEKYDGTPPPPKQVGTRVDNYPELFRKVGRRVALKNWRRLL